MACCSLSLSLCVLSRIAHILHTPPPHHHHLPYLNFEKYNKLNRNAAALQTQDVERSVVAAMSKGKPEFSKL
jgi:hypothetical protein